MAPRRVFPSPETRAAQKLYESLIVTGVGIAFMGMVTTCGSPGSMSRGMKETRSALIKQRACRL